MRIVSRQHAEQIIARQFHVFEHAATWRWDEWVSAVLGREAVRKYLDARGELGSRHQSMLTEVDGRWRRWARLAWHHMQQSGRDLYAVPEAYWHTLRRIAEGEDDSPSPAGRGDRGED